MEAGRQLWKLLGLPGGYVNLPRYQDMVARGFLPRVDASAAPAAVPGSPVSASPMASLAASALASLGGQEGRDEWMCA